MYSGKIAVPPGGGGIRKIKILMKMKNSALLKFQKSRGQTDS
jgi:hypothetical protein